jgi:hypothetical protein
MTRSNEAPDLATAVKYTVLAEMGEGKLFPPIDDGNMGVSAYIASKDGAAALLALAKDLHPGVPIAQSFVYDHDRHTVIVVVTSEDEPHLHVAVLDRPSGDFIPITSINIPDLCGAFLEVFKRHLPGITHEYLDWGDVMTELLSDAQYIDLGKGAAEHLWWT